MQSRAIRGIRVQSRGTHLPSHLTRSKLHGLSRRLKHARLLVRRLRLGLPDRLCHCRLLLRLGTHCRLPQQLLDLNLRRSRWQPEAITGANTGAISGNHRRHQRGQLRSAPVAPPPPSLMREAISMQSQAPSACNQLHLLLRRRLLVRLMHHLQARVSALLGVTYRPTRGFLI